MSTPHSAEQLPYEDPLNPEWASAPDAPAYALTRMDKLRLLRDRALRGFDGHLDRAVRRQGLLTEVLAASLAEIELLDRAIRLELRNELDRPTAGLNDLLSDSPHGW